MNLARQIINTDVGKGIFFAILIREHCSVLRVSDLTCLFQLRRSSCKYVSRVIDIKRGRRANKPAGERLQYVLSGRRVSCRFLFSNGTHISFYLGSHSKMKYRTSGSGSRDIPSGADNLHGCPRTRGPLYRSILIQRLCLKLFFDTFAFR